MGWCKASPLGETPAPVTGEPPPLALAHAAQLKALAQTILDQYAAGNLTEAQLTELAKRTGMAPAGLEGFADDMRAAFTPGQAAVLRLLAKRLRAYARRVGKYHIHGTSQELGKVKLPARRSTERPVRSPERLTALPISGWERDDDAELGILPLIGGLISSVAGPLISGLFGGGDDKPAPAAAPAPTVSTTQPVVMTGGQQSNVSLPAIGGVVADQIRAVPPPVRQQVTDALRESLDRTKAGQQDVAQLMKDISAQLGPGLKAQLDAVNQAALQRQATYEHESLKTADERWKSNADAQKRILARLDQMETKLGTAVTNGNARQRAVARAYGVAPRYLP